MNLQRFLIRESLVADVVSFQCLTSLERFGALDTILSFSIWEKMYLLVRLKQTKTVVSLIASTALMQCFLCMTQQMLTKRSVLYTFTASWTHTATIFTVYYGYTCIFLLGFILVSLQMDIHVAFLGEASATYITDERELCHVNSLVNIEISSSCEGFPT